MDVGRLVAVHLFRRLMHRGQCIKWIADESDSDTGLDVKS